MPASASKAGRISLRSPLGLDHRARPTRPAASSRPALDARRCRLAEQVEVILASAGGSFISLATLLGFEDEAVALVAVDTPKLSVPSPLS